MDRRAFLAAGASAAIAPALSSSQSGVLGEAAQLAGDRVDFGSDGLGLAPREYAALMAEVVGPGYPADFYSGGGPIAGLEQAFARRLGKEAALFLPTGTLANHLAVRKLAGGDRRVLVQAESHLYNDSGDCAQQLSGLNLVPLAPGKAGFTLEDVQEWARRSAGGRVATPVGVISIESPVRRADHAMVPFAQMQRISEWARANGVRMHLDGARLFTLPHHSGHGVEAYAALFDTVYVSLWKHFNGAGGAILAGDGDFIEGLFHQRRMFGGALPHAWPQVALVPRFLETFERDYAAAWQAAEEFIRLLEAGGRFRVRRVPDGTSRFHLGATGEMPAALAQRLETRGVWLPGAPPGTREFPMQVNPTILRRRPAALARLFEDALDG